MDWSKFDKKVDTKALQEEIKEAAESGGGQRGEVPAGTYEVKIEKMELAESKAGNPMVVVWFRILEGNYKNSIIFMNQVVTKGFQFHIVNEFLKSIFGSDADIEFAGYEQYDRLLMNSMEQIDGKMEFVLEYGENNKGFKTFKITEVFDVD